MLIQLFMVIYAIALFSQLLRVIFEILFTILTNENISEKIIVVGRSLYQYDRFHPDEEVFG